jgi:hypothetical protein
MSLLLLVSLSGVIVVFYSIGVVTVRRNLIIIIIILLVIISRFCFMGGGSRRKLQLFKDAVLLDCSYRTNEDFFAQKHCEQIWIYCVKNSKIHARL